MSDWGYVTFGWMLTVAVLVAYTVWILVRGRSLGRRLPPEDRRWM
jgi:hypothetical protein